MHFQFVGAVILGLTLRPAPKTSHSVLIPGLFFRPKLERWDTLGDFATEISSRVAQQ
jgi:hypothetical protein